MNRRCTQPIADVILRNPVSQRYRVSVPLAILNRFIAGTEESPIGRTRTAPRKESLISKFLFAFVSCQHYEQGYYTAYKYLAQDDLHLVVHTGDYIYEGGIYQVYYEHMPLRPFSKPEGPDAQLFRRLDFGKLATFHVLDTRQYRTDQLCGDGTKERCAEVFDPEATILGDRQEQWLYRGLDRSTASWNILAQQVPVAQRDFTPGPGQTFSMDKWDAYLANRS